ncbi:MAG: peptidase [Lachnospiraceae bacterium]|nr:peptidase [Lachnospiraceae bacterium]
MADCREQAVSEDYFDYIFNRYFAEDGDLCRIVAGYGLGMEMRPRAENAPFESYFTLPKLYGLMDVQAADSIGALRVQRTEGLELYGEGCLVGFIDTGIEYDNPVFTDDGGQTRVVSIWDQTDQSGKPPEGLFYGTEYTREQILQGTAGGRDEIGHGTYLTSIVAGRADFAEEFTGIVPQAQIAMVKLKPAKQYLRNFFLVKEDAIAYQETDIMFGARYLLNVARRLQMPLVIVIGVGSNSGPHTGADALSQFLSRAAEEVGVAVVCAAGNEGDKRHHFFGTLTDRQDYTDVELRVGEGYDNATARPGEVVDMPEMNVPDTGFTLELWGSPPDIYTVSIISPEGEVVPRIFATTEESQTYDFIFNRTTIDVSYRLLEFLSGEQLIFMRFKNPTPGIWRLRVFGRNLLEGDFHIWLPINDFIDSETYFLEPDPDTTITAPGNAEALLTVSGYDSETGSFFIESGRGFAGNGEIKPDVAAPAVNVLGVQVSRLPEEVRYVRRSGTSIAAALAAGACVQLFEWGIVRGELPTMRTVEIKNLLIRGAARSTNQVYPNNEFGYGIINIYATFRALIFSGEN